MTLLHRPILLVVLIAACATSAPAPSVREVDAQRFRAVAANDLDALIPMLSDDLVYVHSDAAVESKAQFLERLRNGSLRYYSIEPSDVVARTYGDAAIVTGRMKADVANGGARRTIDLRYTAVYRASGGRWQLVSWQSTRMP